jgi:hypothetical protein
MMIKSSDGTRYIPMGGGIFKPRARPISIQISSDGEYWLCDDGIDANKDFREQGCVAHSEIQMAEGG